MLNKFEIVFWILGQQCWANHCSPLWSSQTDRYEAQMNALSHVKMNAAILFYHIRKDSDRYCDIMKCLRTWCLSRKLKSKCYWTRQKKKGSLFQGTACAKALCPGRTQPKQETKEGPMWQKCTKWRRKWWLMELERVSGTSTKEWFCWSY